MAPAQVALHSGLLLRCAIKSTQARATDGVCVEALELGLQVLVCSYGQDSSVVRALVSVAVHVLCANGYSAVFVELHT